jgi:aldehyde:ferredoxin oxidoreductase
MRNEFYQLRGWNPETGFPTAEKLNKLGLSDLGEEM